MQTNSYAQRATVSASEYTLTATVADFVVRPHIEFYCANENASVHKTRIYEANWFARYLKSVDIHWWYTL